MAAHVAGGGSPFDFVEPPNWFSYSSFDSFERCPRQYVFRYLCHLPTDKPRPAADFGTAAHGAFETFTRERRERRERGEPQPSRGDLELFFDEAWLKTRLSGQADAENWYRRAEPMLDSFWLAEEAHRAETVAEERHFRLRLEVDQNPAFVVIGYIDRIDGLPSGAVEIIDYKSGAATFPNAAESSLQLSIYALACRDALGLGRPERVTLYFLEPARRTSASRTDVFLDALRKELAARVGRIRREEFKPTPSRRACGWCDYASLCPARSL
jgi:putative RecB family exonuclease